MSSSLSRAHQERVEAVELAEAALDRRLQVVALAQPPLEEAAGRLGVVVGLEFDAERLELLAHQMRIRQRAVVHQAKVAARGERMRMRRRDRRFGGHAGVADQVRAAQRRRTVALGDVGRRAHILVQIDASGPTDSTATSAAWRCEPAAHLGRVGRRW